ncbi:hypothetical protein AeRB84_013339 [Aphanomyces euteiches]|nr:hypothetical protein AeRB84_013339 [Aphanomyces euteiches]
MDYVAAHRSLYHSKILREDLSLRDQVATALLSNTSIQQFMICGIEASNISFDGYCGYYDSKVTFDFYSPRRYGVEPVLVSVDELNLDEITRDLVGLVEPFFQSLLNPKVKKLELSGRGTFTDGVIWEMLIPYLQQSHLEELNLGWNQMRDHEALLLAEGIRCMKSLTKIVLEGNRLGSAGMKAIIAAVPASVSHIYISYAMNDLTATCFIHAYGELLEMAKKKSIILSH